MEIELTWGILSTGNTRVNNCRVNFCVYCRDILRKSLSTKHLRPKEIRDKIQDMDISAITERLNEAIDLLARLKTELSAEAPSLPKEAQALLDAGYCLFCKQKIEPGERVVRGCHERHARRIARSIDAGEITDNEAIARGIIAPQSTAGRKKMSILDEIDRLAEKADAAAAIKMAEDKVKRMKLKPPKSKP